MKVWNVGAVKHGRKPACVETSMIEGAQRAMTAGFEARNLVVVLTENGLGDWSFGEGVAQYLDDPPGGRSVR